MIRINSLNGLKIILKKRQNLRISVFTFQERERKNWESGEWEKEKARRYGRKKRVTRTQCS
jgi:hypothetical protein